MTDSTWKPYDTLPKKNGHYLLRDANKNVLPIDIKDGVFTYTVGYSNFGGAIEWSGPYASNASIQHTKTVNMKKFIETVIFSSRWLLLPFYLGLFIAMIVYTYVYVKEIYHLVSESPTLTRDMVLLTTLELVDIVMIANLVKMIITGSYNSFVSKDHGYKGENVSSGALKVKMGSSLVGVSSIHLLQTFIDAAQINWQDFWKQIIIHVTFLIGASVLARIDYLHEKSTPKH